MVEYAGATVRTSDLFGQNSKNPLSMTKKFMKGLKVFILLYLFIPIQQVFLNQVF